jgi:hypothetical protein
VRLWDIVTTEIAALTQGDALEKSLQKIDTSAAGIGSVMFFEDETVVLGLQEQFPLYAHNFPVWSDHSTGIAQLGVWTTLADVVIGASLQHYNPLIKRRGEAEWSLPETWRLRAQMPFGSNEAPFPKKGSWPRTSASIPLGELLDRAGTSSDRRGRPESVRRSSHKPLTVSKERECDYDRERKTTYGGIASRRSAAGAITAPFDVVLAAVAAGRSSWFDCIGVTRSATRRFTISNMTLIWKSSERSPRRAEAEIIAAPTRASRTE